MAVRGRPETTSTRTSLNRAYPPRAPARWPWGQSGPREQGCATCRGVARQSWAPWNASTATSADAGERYPSRYPSLFRGYPWTLLDGVTRSWIGAWRWRGHGAADLREAIRTEKRTNRPTRQDRRGRPRHQPDPRGQIHAVGSWPYTKKQANGHRRCRSPGDRLARARNTWLLPQNPRGRSTTREGTRRRRAESPLPCYPPRALRIDGLA